MGPYLLNVLVQPAGPPPFVTAVFPPEGDVLTASPAQLTVQFDKTVNLEQLSYQLSQQSTQLALPQVFIRGEDGSTYYPRLLSFDQTSNQATFQLLDRLPNGVNALHLSGRLGLTDLGGNPLLGNDPSGDYVVHFTLQAPVPDKLGRSTLWSDREAHDTLSHPQSLGVLFPTELQAGVLIRRDFTDDSASAPSDTADFYQIQLLQSRPYFFTLTGSGLPAGTQPILYDATGHPIRTLAQGGGAVRLANLDAGVYEIGIGGWSPAQASHVTYQLRIRLGGSVENPTPLTVGPGPAVFIRLASPPAPPPAPEGPPPPTDSTPSVLGPSTPPGLPGREYQKPPVPSGTSESPPPATAPTLPALPIFSGVVTPPGAAASGAANTTNDVSLALVIPTEVLSQLAANSVGGVKGTDTSVATLTPDRLIVRGPDPVVTNVLVRMVVLTQEPHASGETAPPVAPIPNMVTAHTTTQGAVSQVWKKGVTVFFQIGGSLSDEVRHWLERAGFLAHEALNPDRKEDTEFPGEGDASATPLKGGPDHSSAAPLQEWERAATLVAVLGYPALEFSKPRGSRLPRIPTARKQDQTKASHLC